MSEMLTKQTLAAAGLRPSDLARLIRVAPNTVSRYTSDGAERIEAPAAVVALVYAWPHLPEETRMRMLAGDHLNIS